MRVRKCEVNNKRVFLVESVMSEESVRAGKVRGGNIRRESPGETERAITESATARNC
jgi:hypothetical protein